MKRVFQRLFGASPQRKSALGSPMVQLHTASRGMFADMKGASLVGAGFHRNAIVYRAVRLIAESAASVPLTLRANGSEVQSHALESLLARPNPRESGAELMEAVYGHLLLSGNAYLEALGDERPSEIYALRPDRVTPVLGQNGWVRGYDYAVGGVVSHRRVEEEGVSPILHLKLFDPLDDTLGFAPLHAARMALEMHEAATRWNKALLDNSARPSGALVYAAADHLPDDQFERLKAELEGAFSGQANAGKPLLLEGGLDWKPLSLSPKDMDFLEAKAGAAREIALAFGVPPLLLGMPGDNTYSNYVEANRAFWRSTILPLVRRTSASLVQWLQPAFDEALVLEPDLDKIEALSSERDGLWKRVSAADFLSEDEKRAELGYGTRAKPE